MRSLQLKDAGKYTLPILFIIIIVFPHILYRHTLTDEVIIGYPGGDLLSQGALFAEYALRSLREDGVFAWYNPYLFCGMPYIESISYSYSYPMNWIFFFLPFVFAQNYQFTFHLVLFGIITALIIGWYYKKIFPGFIAALCIIVNSHIISLTYPGHGEKLFALLYFLPLFYLFRSLLKSYRFPVAMLFVLLTVFQIKLAHLQVVFYTGIFLFIYGLYYFITRYHQRKLKDWGRLSLLSFCLLVLIILGSAHKIFPTLHYKQFTVRAEIMEWEESLRGSLPPGEVSEMVWLGAFGYSHSDNYEGLMGQRLITDFILPVLLVLSIMYFLRGHKDRWFYLIIIFLALFIGTGKYNPLLPFFYRVFPVFRFFRAPMAILCLVHFCIIITALETLNRGDYLKRQWKDILVFAVILVGTLFLTPDNYFLSRPFWLTLILYAVVWMALSVRGSYHRYLFILAFMLNIVAGLFHVHNFIPTVPADDYYRHLQSPPLMRFMQPGSDKRLLFIQNEKANRFMYQKATSLYGYHPLGPTPYLDFTREKPPLQYPQYYNLRLIFSYTPQEINGFERVSVPGIPYAYKNQAPPSFVKNLSTQKHQDYDFIRHNTNVFEVNFDLEQESTILIAENRYPGWKVYNNGQKIQSKDAEHPFFEFILPPGTHEMYFQYSLPYLYVYAGTFILFIFGLFLLKYVTIKYSQFKSE